jgi:NitT/TauT family transport system permease protein
MARLVNFRLSRPASIAVGLLPIVILILVYIVASANRDALIDSPRILPTLGEMAEGFSRMAFEVDTRTGLVPLVADTLASLSRLGIGLAIATLLSLFIGLSLGLMPAVRSGFGPSLAVLSVIPPIAVLPILFIILGLGEAAKIALIVVGIAPTMMRDLTSHVAAIPREEIVKAQTLGASTWQIALRIGLPRMMPRLLSGLRLAIGPAFVFLITAEAIASDVGLGYRIFLVRRFLAMDIILPYVAWISVLALIFDACLAALSRWLYPWAQVSEGASEGGQKRVSVEAAGVK